MRVEHKICSIMCGTPVRAISGGGGCQGRSKSARKMDNNEEEKAAIEKKLFTHLPSYPFTLSLLEDCLVNQNFNLVWFSKMAMTEWVTDRGLRYPIWFNSMSFKYSFNIRFNIALPKIQRYKVAQLCWFFISCGVCNEMVLSIGKTQEGLSRPDNLKIHKV